MDAWWIAPVAALVLGLVLVAVAARSVRRSTLALAGDLPALSALRDDVAALDRELAVVGARLDHTSVGAGGATGDR